MTFINIELQHLYFEAQYARRQKRYAFGLTSTEQHIRLLDKCLDMILCHDPDVWSKGTGVLLVASITTSRLMTMSQKRALNLRIEARDYHHYDRELRPLIEESFGFFVRKTLEYRDRMRNYAYDTDQILYEESFDYIENMSQVIEDFSLQAEVSRCTGVRRYGISFDEPRQVTKGQTNYQIIDEITEVSSRDGSSYFLHVLRNVLHEFIPEIFDGLEVRRELSFEDDFDEMVESSDSESCTCIVPELVEVIGECIVCFVEGRVLQWPCHFSHIFCKECTDKIVEIRALCPLCRECMLIPNPVMN